jgi:hypothetical protein
LLHGAMPEELRNEITLVVEQLDKAAGRLA